MKYIILILMLVGITPAFADVIESENGMILILSENTEVFIDGLDTTIIRERIDGDNGRILGKINDSNATFFLVYDISDNVIKAKFWNHDTKFVFDTIVTYPSL